MTGPLIHVKARAFFKALRLQGLAIFRVFGGLGLRVLWFLGSKGSYFRDFAGFWAFGGLGFRKFGAPKTLIFGVILGPASLAA